MSCVEDCFAIWHKRDIIHSSKINMIFMEWVDRAASVMCTSAINYWEKLFQDTLAEWSKALA